MDKPCFGSACFRLLYGLFEWTHFVHVFTIFKVETFTNQRCKFFIWPIVFFQQIFDFRYFRFNFTQLTIGFHVQISCTVRLFDQYFCVWIIFNLCCSGFFAPCTFVFFFVVFTIYCFFNLNETFLISSRSLFMFYVYTYIAFASFFFKIVVFFVGPTFVTATTIFFAVIRKIIILCLNF